MPPETLNPFSGWTGHKQLTAALIASALVSLLFFTATGTLNSGFHFIDDHEMLNIAKSLEDQDLHNRLAFYVLNDLTIRFRPLYYLHRVMQVKIFGPDFLALSLYTWFLASLTFASTYVGLRKLGHSVILSLLSVLVIYMGTQMAVWWRLGTSETLGALFVGLSIMFMGRSRSEQYHARNTFYFALSITAAALSKESFLVALPAFLFLKIWSDKSFFGDSFRAVLKENYQLILPAAVFVLSAYVILFHVGTNEIGYAGAPTSIIEFIVGVGSILLSESGLRAWVLLSLVLSAFLLADVFWKSETRNGQANRQWGALISAGVFFSLILASNLLIYAKSGVYERYRLPSTFGFAFFYLGLIHVMNRRNLVLAASISIGIFVSFNIHKAYIDAAAFAEDGFRTNRLLKQIKAVTTASSTFLLIADPVSRFEVSNSLRSYLRFHQRPQLFAHPLARADMTPFEKELYDAWLSWFSQARVEHLSSPPDIVIALDHIDTSELFNSANLDESAYETLVPQTNGYFAYRKRRVWAPDSDQH